MTKAAFNGGCNPNRKQPVPRACNNCKASHLACDLFRPCKRCVLSGKTDSCRDVKHRKRGRPKLHGERSASHGYRWESRNPQDAVGRTVRVLRIDAIRCISFISENERASHYGEPKKYEGHIESQRSETLPDPEPPPRIQCSVVTLYLSMDLCCARVSDEAILLWGYHPQELVHKSIYTFIATSDRQRIQRLHERLLKEIWTKSSTSTYEDLRHLFSSERVVSSLISQADPAALAVFAKEAGKFTDTVDISKRLGDKERFQVSLYLGGRLGGDLRLKATFSKLYIVANFTRMKATTTEKEDWGSDPDIRADVRRGNDKETIAANKEFEAHSVQQRGISILNNLEELPVRPGMLPGHFSRNSQLNTISFSDPKLRSPRIHVAVKHDVSHQQHFRLSVPTRTTLLPIPGSNPTSTQAYRHAPSTLSRSGTPNTFVSRATTSTNPTAQYFLQTSSSSLNAAASAIQGKQPSETETDVTSGVGLAGNSSNKLLGKKDSAQQHAPRMSIRSLLS